MRRSRLVLASASATRARLLSAAGIEFECDPADVDEAAIKIDLERTGAGAADVAHALCAAKAMAVSERHPDAYVIGADQILEHGGQKFDKASSLDDARRQLQALRGRTHSLVCGVCAVHERRLTWRHEATARLEMRDFSDEFLDAYLIRAEDACRNSVGAYYVEGLGAQLFARIDGDHFTIQGLPMLALMDFLRREGLLAS
ncbi:MAG: septum formation protein Maf [Rhodospirillales bacterium]|jgi:septum formation protein|nr:septum formation protein Maf [Rhodospirillales bacterium]